LRVNASRTVKDEQEGKAGAPIFVLPLITEGGMDGCSIKIKLNHTNFTYKRQSVAHLEGVRQQFLQQKPLQEPGLLAPQVLLYRSSLRREINALHNCIKLIQAGLTDKGIICLIFGGFEFLELLLEIRIHITSSCGTTFLLNLCSSVGKEENQGAHTGSCWNMLAK